VRLGLSHGRLCLLDGRARLFESKLCVARVELRDDLPFLHVAPEVDADRDDASADRRRNVRLLVAREAARRFDVAREVSHNRRRGRNVNGLRRHRGRRRLRVRLRARAAAGREGRSEQCD
jgi:hypothetical protein